MNFLQFLSKYRSVEFIYVSICNVGWCLAMFHVVEVGAYALNIPYSLDSIHNLCLLFCFTRRYTHSKHMFVSKQSNHQVISLWNFFRSEVDICAISNKWSMYRCTMLNVHCTSYHNVKFRTYSNFHIKTVPNYFCKGWFPLLIKGLNDYICTSS